MKTKYIAGLLKRLEDAEADLCWYLQHEKFDEKKETQLRKVCTKLRERIKLNESAK